MAKNIQVQLASRPTGPVEEANFKVVESDAPKPGGGEVLVNVRGTLGGVSVATPEMTGWNVSREVAVVPADLDQIEPKYLAIWIGCDATQRWLSGVERGVAYTGINIEDLRELPVQVPPMIEQAEIVRRVESLFAWADRLENRHAAADTSQIASGL